MAVKSNFDARANLEELMREGEKIHELIIEAMQQAGEEFVIACRKQPGGSEAHSSGFYEDKTAHLRNSIEYFIFHNGEVVKGSGSDFTAQNRADIAEMIKPEGFQLIGIAGMNYASAVESGHRKATNYTSIDSPSYAESKGYNVISIQKDQLYVDLDNYIKGIQKYLNG